MMRISIWRQFGSNHSGGFTIVGTFPTRQEAEKAAADLQSMMQIIRDWHEKNPDWMEGKHPLWLLPSPPEIEVAEKYKLEWEMAIDFYDRTETRFLDHHLIVNVDDTWSGPNPIIQFINQSGGKTVYEAGVDGEVFANFHVRLTCTAPDDESAQTLAQELTSLLKTAEASLNAPWNPKKEWRLQIDGTVSRDGRNLTLDSLHGLVFTGLPPLMDYLKSKGCENIHYAFVQEEINY
jgi:hypothetical protein